MSIAFARPRAPVENTPSLRTIVPVLGVAQILAWGSSYYLPTVFAQPIARDTGWSVTWIVGGLSLGLFVAGIVSPQVGKSILRFGGRRVLSMSALCFALGLIGLALSRNLPLYIASWVVLGVGMGTGLYDAAFAMLGRAYGQSARTAITTLTLFGGFASTVCWPLSALLIAKFGWRDACLAYASIQLLVLLPLYLFALPKESNRQLESASVDSHGRNVTERSVSGSPNLLFIVTAAILAIGSMISALLSVHLLTILQARGIALNEAVAFGTLVGPSQVGARAIEMAIGGFHHPIWTKLTSCVLVAIGVGLLWADLPIVLPLILYGAGIGIQFIARGTLPLAIFGEHQYPAIMGRLAMPSLIVQAASPSLGSILIETFGPGGALGAVDIAAIVNVLLVGFMFALLSKRSVDGEP